MNISVIIPTYNRKHLLAYTLSNIKQQSLKPFEIIVVDDSSTDGTYEWLCDTFTDIIILKNIGSGPGAARNTGLRIATGDYIQFFDSDDLMSLNKLETQANLLGNRNDTFVYGAYAIATAPPDEWKLLDAIIQFQPLPDSNLLKWMYRGWCSITQACLFPSALIKKVGYWREDIHTHEDREYWYRVAQAIRSPPIHENISCTIYRQHTQQLTLASERQLQRSFDSLVVDSSMQVNEFPKDLFSSILLNARISATKVYVNRYSHTYDILLMDSIYVQFLRIFNKIERLKSKSNWQSMYGANTQVCLFDSYVEKLKFNETNFK